MINYEVSFQQISSVIDISVAELSFLNPQYRKQFIPDLPESCVLILPKDKVREYLRSEREVLAYTVPRDDYNQLKQNAGSTENMTHILHTVKKGEYFHKIALNYCCTIENIKAWNDIASSVIHPGQTLNIWVRN